MKKTYKFFWLVVLSILSLVGVVLGAVVAIDKGHVWVGPLITFLCLTIMVTIIYFLIKIVKQAEAVRITIIISIIGIIFQIVLLFITGHKIIASMFIGILLYLLFVTFNAMITMISNEEKRKNTQQEINEPDDEKKENIIENLSNNPEEMDKLIDQFLKWDNEVFVPELNKYGLYKEDIVSYDTKDLILAFNTSNNAARQIMRIRDVLIVSNSATYITTYMLLHRLIESRKKYNREIDTDFVLEYLFEKKYIDSIDVFPISHMKYWTIEGKIETNVVNTSNPLSLAITGEVLGTGAMFAKMASETHTTTYDGRKIAIYLKTETLIINLIGNKDMQRMSYIFPDKRI